MHEALGYFFFAWSSRLVLWISTWVNTLAGASLVKLGRADVALECRSGSRKIIRWAGQNKMETTSDRHDVNVRQGQVISRLRSTIQVACGVLIRMAVDSEPMLRGLMISPNTK